MKPNIVPKLFLIFIAVNSLIFNSAGQYLIPVSWVHWENEDYSEPYDKPIYRAYFIGDQLSRDWNINDFDLIWDTVPVNSNQISKAIYPIEPEVYSFDTLSSDFKVVYDREYVYILMRYFDVNHIADENSRLWEVHFDARNKDRYEEDFIAAGDNIILQNMSYARYLQFGGKAHFQDGEVMRYEGSDGLKGSWAENLFAQNVLKRDNQHFWSVDENNTIKAILTVRMDSVLSYTKDPYGSTEDIANRELFKPFDDPEPDTISFEIKMRGAIDEQRFDYGWSSDNFNVYASNYYAGYLILNALPINPEYKLFTQNDFVTKVDSIIDIPINVEILNPEEDIFSTDFKINYDTSTISYISYSTQGGLCEDGIVAIEHQNGILNVNIESKTAIFGAAYLLNFQFKGKKTGVSELSFSDIYLNSIIVENFTNGRIEVLSNSFVQEYGIYGKVIAEGEEDIEAVIVLFSVDSGKYKAIDYCFTNSEGEYSFEEKLKSSKYTILATPNPLQSENTLLPTYYANNTDWRDAELIELVGKAYNVNIYLQKGFNVNTQSTGVGEISGFVTLIDSGSYENDVFMNNWFYQIDNENSTESLTKISNIPIYLLNNDDIIAWQLSDKNGFFSFSDLPEGKYNIIGEKAGLPVSYDPDIYLGNNNMSVDSVEVVIRSSDIITNLSGDVSFNQNNIKVYPNPAVDNICIDLDMYNGCAYSLEIFNAFGQIQLKIESYKPKGKTTCEADISPLTRGLYIGKINVGDDTAVFSFIKR